MKEDHSLLRNFPHHRACDNLDARSSAQRLEGLDDFITISSFPVEHHDSAVLGAIPFKAAIIDPRASYCMYVPSAAFTVVNETDSKLPPIVNVHGSRRARTVVSVRVVDPNDADNYKEVLYRDIRYDEILLGMLEEVKVRWEGIIDTDRFFLTGFSGGGQYALRFLYLHPERLRAASIGAPGTVTSINESSWPRGVGDLDDLFGIEADVDKIRDVKLHMVVGKLDTGVAGEGIRDVLGGQVGAAGRVKVLEGLVDELTELGIEARLDVVPGVEHDALGVLPAMTSFLKGVMPRVNMTGLCE